MPDIEDWIKEKLNAGYSKEQIRQSLIKGGYDPNLVEEVINKKLIGRETNINLMPKASGRLVTRSQKKVMNVPLIVLLFVIAVAGIVYLVFVFQTEEKQPPFDELCQGYPIVRNETNISQTICEQAIKIALNRYPGEVESVSKGQPRIGNETKDAWLVRINLDRPLGSGDNLLYNIAVAVGLNEPKIIGMVK